jgi:hypothetical protein
VSVVTRQNDRASGRVSVFSVLNLDAARCARGGDTKSASAFAEGAATVESSKDFVRFCEMLSGSPAAVICSTLEGQIPEAQRAELEVLLRAITLKTRQVRAKQSTPAPRGVFLGKISEQWPDFLVLRSGDGVRTMVPRPLAHSVHREEIDDCMALVTDQIDDHQMVINAVPAIDVPGPGETAFTAFGRGAPVHAVTESDAQLLSRRPRKLKILVPVAIDR